MAYLGRQPVLGNFVKLDAISVVNGQAAYTMQNGGVNFTDYTTVNQFLVSLNGTIQAPTSSFTVSGSTLTFASNLSTGDVIDFIIVFGNSLSAGTVSDSAITTAKLADGAITSAKLASGVGGVTGIVSNADATAITIDSSENVGIGTTSPSSRLSMSGSNTTTYSASSVGGQDTSSTLKIQNTSNVADTFASIDFNTNNNRIVNRIVSGHTNSTVNGFLAFVTEKNGTPAERMRITHNGHLLLGTTSETARLCIASTTSAGTDPLVVFSDSGGTTCGSIDLNASGNTVAYVTSSDYRLKENVNYNFDATSRLKQLKPARFNFIADADTTVDGFIAHEVSDIVPEAITKTKDAVKVWKDNEELPDGVSVGDNKLDENGNTIPDYQGIDQAKLVPLLVKTIQELEARITALENA